MNELGSDSKAKRKGGRFGQPVLNPKKQKKDNPPQVCYRPKSFVSSGRVKGREDGEKEGSAARSLP